MVQHRFFNGLQDLLCQLQLAYRPFKLHMIETAGGIDCLIIFLSGILAKFKESRPLSAIHTDFLAPVSANAIYRLPAVASDQKKLSVEKSIVYRQKL